MGIRCHVLSDHPDFLFAELDPQYCIVRKGGVDFGIVQDSWRSPDIEKTSELLIELSIQRDSLIKREKEYCTLHKINLIIADIPTIPLVVADELGIPSIGISNFEWHFIYSRMFKGMKNDQIDRVLNQMKADYQKATLGVRLPLSSKKSMGAFNRVIKTGVLARESNQTTKKVYDTLSIPDNKQIILLVYVGDSSEEIGVLEELCKLDEYVIIGKNTRYIHKNYITIPPDFPFQDVIAASAIVVTKTGYSTIAETVQTGKGLICFDRNGFPEDEVLRKGVESYSRGLFTPNVELPNLKWKELIKTIEAKLERPIAKEFRNNNSKIARLITEEYFKSYGGVKSNRYSVIDVGTNNVLLLWAEKVNGEIKVVHRASRISAMGKNMKEGMLTGAGICRVKRILRDFITYSKTFTDNIIVTGTSCSRESKNIHILADWLKRLHKIGYRVLSEEEEAYYTALANRAHFATEPELIIFDIGGGSTEFVYIKGEETLFKTSLKLGVRRLQSIPINDTEKIESQIDKLLSQLPQNILNKPVIVGVGGTVTNVAAMKQKQYYYDGGAVHGSLLTQDDFRYYINTFRKLKVEEIAKWIPYEPLRADVIVIGMTIALKIMEYYSVDSIYVSDYGLQFGILQEA